MPWPGRSTRLPWTGTTTGPARRPATSPCMSASRRPSMMGRHPLRGRPTRTHPNRSMPPVQNDSSARSVANYNNVINQFAVQANPRYTLGTRTATASTRYVLQHFRLGCDPSNERRDTALVRPDNWKSNRGRRGQRDERDQNASLAPRFWCAIWLVSTANRQDAQDSANAGRPTIVIGTADLFGPG